ncbi:MAG TPA: hypothetical protein VEO74_08605, partial [Thermoanaerobaculia bacterium]|nr:hypothetical protein [Thermoanaerobaculia bacterium]
MRRELLSLVLLLVAPVAAAVSYPVEREISPRRGGPTSPWQGDVHGASDGENFLIVWNDGRAATPANIGRFPLTAMAQLVDGRGKVLDTIVLPFNGFTVWNGRNYVVATSTQFVRIGRDGALLDTAPRALPVTPVAQLASNGSTTLAISTASDRTIHATLLDDDMQIVRATQQIGNDALLAFVDVAANSSGFCVFYSAFD